MRNPFRKPGDGDLDREMNFHVEQLRQDNLARGMTEEEARRQAILEFGGKEQVKEELRDVHRIPLLETLAGNLRFAWRMVRKAPVFSATVIVTLALGIGANTAVFSAVDAVLLRPLPYPQADRLVTIEQRETRSRNLPIFIAPARLEDWNRMSSTLQGITGWYTEDASETSGPMPEKLTRAFVAPRFLQVLGVSPLLGRDFAPEEEKFGGPNAILISYRFWQERFHGAPEAVGQRLHFGKSSATIVGVMPASFRFPDRGVDFWDSIPVNSPYAQNRESTWYRAVGRLKAGVAIGQASADLAVVQQRLGKQFPATDAKLTVIVEPLKETTVSGSRTSLWLLYGAVTLLLLIACTNVAALLLARATDREAEISVRFALGGSRRTVITQLLTETLVLASLGALAGLGIAVASQNVFRALASDLPRVDEIAINWRIALYAFGCAMAATLICGILPAWRATRSSLAGSLRRAGRTQVSGRNPMQWALVGLQVALAVTLLVGAGLLLRSFQELGRVSPGFDVARVLTLRVSGSYGETVDMKALTQRINRLLDTLRSVPGVQAAASTTALPGVPRQYPTELKVLDGEQDPNHKIMADTRFVSSGYFATMQIPMLSGEGCREETGETDVIVNRSFAAQYFGENPVLGHHLQIASDQAGFALAGRIRGIAGDAREQGLNRAPMPTVYWCMSAATPSPYYLVRGRGDPRLLAGALRRAIFQAEPGRSVYDIIPLADELSDAFAENRLRMVLLTGFAMIAISLACIGLYGTLSYLVSLRRTEVGLRLALGAARRQIVLRFLGQGLRVCAIGCACGLALAAASGRLLRGMLYGVTPLDAPTLMAVVLLLLLVAGLAALLPAWRASRTEPMDVLREG